MPHIEVLPNSTSISAPGWAYVPDTGYDPSKSAIQPSGSRKRAARASGLVGGDTSARQHNATLRHLAELDKDNYRDVQIQVPPKYKESVSKGGLVSAWILMSTLRRSHLLLDSKGKTTPNVRRILMSQKTFANHLADEEAAIAAQAAQATSMQPVRTLAPTNVNSSHEERRSSRATVESSTASNKLETQPNISTISSVGEPRSEDPLLKTYVPQAPSPAVIEALLAGPPLSYNAARSLPPAGKPQRRFCEICGYWGTIKCLKCGARVCGLECKTAHDEGRCLKFYA
ncbi:MAG: hypothetical protein LQ342_004045 [Letrouitia transgressa]|nr:MAG: hypothetical protein LQ342_004045 [Letrouitia transgressa]